MHDDEWALDRVRVRLPDQESFCNLRPMMAFMEGELLPGPREGQRLGREIHPHVRGHGQPACVLPGRPHVRQRPPHRGVRRHHDARVVEVDVRQRGHGLAIQAQVLDDVLHGVVVVVVVELWRKDGTRTRRSL